jgi:hypothetical protein
MKPNRTGLAMCVSMAASIAGAATPAANPEMNGRWVMNAEKSQGPPAVSEVLTFRISGGEEHYVIEDIEQDGRKLNTEYTAKLDGKEYPNRNLITGEVTYVALRQLFPRVEEVNNTRHVKDQSGHEVSQVTSRYIRILSPDGKEYISLMIDAHGDVLLARVFERQPPAHPQ